MKVNEQTEKKENRVAVSVIIPVYNVLEWLDPCMESVVGQTFTDFEAILLDDGSTDGSGERCDEWAQRDGRLRVVHKGNEGPSVARNLGIELAKGTYLVFLDADDWVDSRYLELMYQRAAKTNADFVECDVYRVNSKTGIKTYRVCSGNMGLDYTLEEHMKYGYTAIWKCMVRKDLFIKNGIMFPDCHSEARAVYPLLLAVSNRVENIHHALYYYRIFREGSLTAKPRPHNEDENAIGIRALEILLENFQRCGIYEKYKKILQEIVKIKLTDLLAVFFYRKEKEDYRMLVENYDSFVAEKFPDAPDFRYMTLGGYNLNRILMNMNLMHDPYCRFNFTGIISLMNPVGMEFSCKHKNRYREMMLEREIRNQFWDVLKEKQPKYLFIDFIEERFDILSYGGGYLTKSDAFDGAECSVQDFTVISRRTDECRLLWERSCKGFTERMDREYPSTEIVLVKNYLSEKVGDVYSQNIYPDLEGIRRTNMMLKEYYDFFENHCSHIKVVEASECGYYFTDLQYEYGAVPSHLNELANRAIAGMIERSIGI